MVMHLPAPPVACGPGDHRLGNAAGAVVVADLCLGLEIAVRRAGRAGLAIPARQAVPEGIGAVEVADMLEDPGDLVPALHLAGVDHEAGHSAFFNSARPSGLAMYSSIRCRPRRVMAF